MDPMRPVTAGEPLRIAAEAWNRVREAARRQHVRGGLPVGRAPTVSRSDTTLLVLNDTGYDLAPFEIAGIDVALPTYADNADEFQTRTGVSVVTPADAHLGRFVVMVEPTPDGEAGVGLASGVTVCQVEIVEEEHSFADITSGDRSKLTSGHYGSAEILWKPGTGNPRWCIVRLGVMARPPFTIMAVAVTQTGGSAGSASTKCSFTYTATDLDGNTLGTGLSPAFERRSSLGQMVAGTKGTGYWERDGDFVLFQVDEVEAVADCDEVVS